MGHNESISKRKTHSSECLQKEMDKLLDRYQVPKLNQDQVNNIKIEKPTFTWKLNDTLLNDTLVKEERKKLKTF